MIMQAIFFFHCHMKIVVAMVTEVVKMLQNHMDSKINQKLFKLD